MRVFVNAVPLEVGQGADVRAAVQALDVELERKLAAGAAFVTVFFLLPLFLAAQAPELVISDRRYQVLPLYFSRPLTRWSYALARLTVIVGMLSVVTWIPGLLLFGLQVGLAGGWWFVANWTLGAGLENLRLHGPAIVGEGDVTGRPVRPDRGSAAASALDPLELVPRRARNLVAGHVGLRARLSEDARVDHHRSGTEPGQSLAHVGDLVALRVERPDQQDGRAHAFSAQSGPAPSRKSGRSRSAFSAPPGL